jgi:hypothetical protein
MTDCFIDIFDTFNSVYEKISIIFTVNTDIINISKDPIIFKGNNLYKSYNIIKAPTERERRIVHWFYRNIDIPTYLDWVYVMNLFDLNEIPSHTIQLYDYGDNPLDIFITIHHIDQYNITYSLDDKIKNIKKMICIPLGIAALVPEKFITNLNWYYNRNIDKNT